MKKANERPGYQLRVWLNTADLEALKKISDYTETPQTELLNRIAHAGLAALSDAGKLALPLRFKVISDDSN
jgi:Na+-translocating ferredoxin:NAD+ oxidoreductase RnfC subunit